ncbi:LacI family DNA-binding transcriptional regulator [Pedobacter mucosus]|uniref:LacI family DNA-binding transcriptional regulator n=1 Tax=Pedobacter mucosus TaxID=2895286 RepID=UPI001EE3ED6C|nr:LacI family DNA-binding transcriptional regulator [Pedobacter mucosus]UKT62973.1 LacI family transcriptional regulator [Pedobacter mucosus]
MHKKEITIYDIAEKLDISPSTVSRALNENSLVNKKTQKKILAAATLMGYRSNTFAANLRMQRTNTIGIIVPRLNSYFMAEVISGVENVTNEAGYNLIISQSMENPEKEIKNLKTMFNNRVDGLLVSLASGSDGISGFGVFEEKKIPVLFFDRVPTTVIVPSVTIDNETAGFQMTTHLLNMGAKKVFHITGDQSVNVYRDRTKGYKKALLAAGLSFNENQLIITDLSEEAGIEAANLIMKNGGDGIFVANDGCAASCINELKRQGKNIPKDIIVGGFNNDMISRNIDPPLTTIDYPGFEMGRVIASKLLDHLGGKFDMHSTPLITMKSDLLVRSSSSFINRNP